MSPKLSVFCVSGWRGVQIAIARFAGDDRWHPLMSVGVERLPDFKMAFAREEAAQSAAYLGVQLYLRIITDIEVPPFESLKWISVADPDTWLERFYSLPLWPTQRTKTKAPGAGVERPKTGSSLRLLLS
jgi:hypothetical protein